jgi:uncharacterized protein (TIGR02391 family)
MDTRLLKLLKEQINKIGALKNDKQWGPNYDIWKNTTSNLIRDLFGEEYLKLFNKQQAVVFSYTDESFNIRQYLEELDNKKQFIESAITEFERLESDSILNIGRFVGFNDYDLHQRIKEVVGKKFEDGHYAEAVEAGFKEVIKRVKDYVNAQDGGNLDGTKVMSRAFDFDRQNPLIKFNNLQSEEEKDEQRGIAFLFKGIVGIRNRKAHENIALNDPYRALDYLALASLLMRLLDEYEK